METRWREIKSPIWGTPTGFNSIDRVTGGLHPSEVTILAARTSHGKTSLASQIAFNVAFDLLAEQIQSADAEAPGQVLIISPEMTTEQLLLRQASQVAEVPSRRITSGTATDEERQAWLTALTALERLEPVMHIEAGRSFDVAAVEPLIENRLNLGPPVKLILIDYLQRLSAGSARTPYDRASVISQTLKDLANVYEVPVLLLSQLNRDVTKRQGADSAEERLPDLQDIRDSGRIEEDADTVFLLWRPVQLTREVNEDAQPATLRIAKNRNGSVGVVPLYFYPHLTMFVDGRSDRVEIDGGFVE